MAKLAVLTILDHVGPVHLPAVPQPLLNWIAASTGRADGVAEVMAGSLSWNLRPFPDGCLEDAFPHALLEVTPYIRRRFRSSYHSAGSHLNLETEHILGRFGV